MSQILGTNVRLSLSKVRERERSSPFIERVWVYLSRFRSKSNVDRNLIYNKCSSGTLSKRYPKNILRMFLEDLCYMSSNFLAFLALIIGSK